LTAVTSTAVRTEGHPARGGLRLPLSWIGVVPFLGYVSLFLLLPTGIVAYGAFVGPDGFTLSKFGVLTEPNVVTGFVNSLIVSLASALVGAIAGAILAYAVVTGNPNGVFRRFVTAACGVLAQFGGVTLAFAFIASIGTAGVVFLFLKDHGIDLYPGQVWLYKLPGLVLVYAYFQIPLMVLVFLPALDGIKPQWREATESLGGNAWHYWRYVAGPLMLPAFTGASLLLFANSFSAYATAAALINQGGIVIPLQISNALTSEVGLHSAALASTLALGMVVIVTTVMIAYSLLQNRTAKWLQ
jgi:putative spermidine/putrescine transport system permease protein